MIPQCSIYILKPASNGVKSKTPRSRMARGVSQFVAEAD
jgi:hypothetical protein